VAGSTTTNFTYDNSDQLLSTAVVGGATTSYSYDNAGRRTSSGSTTLGWNQQDRMVSFGSSAGYAYNGVGLRTSKTVSGTAEAFVWEVADGLPLLIGDGTTSYVSGPGGLPLEQINGSTVLYYQQDQLGSTRAITDSTGAVAESYTYDAYGNISSQSGSVSNPFLYSGEYRDGESGYYNLRARYYDPSTGQFISRDPKDRVPLGPHLLGPLSSICQHE
jgi:RHS repeat-associated protein